MQKLFMRKPTHRFAAALNNLGIKQVKGKTPGSNVSQQIRQLLNKKYYTPGQKAELRRLDEIKQEINAQSGAYINPKKKYKGRTDKALETEHTQAIISVLKKLKINPKEFLENADPAQIKKVGRLALKDENLRAATKLANNEKDMLFENTQMGGYWSKDSAFNKMLKIDSLRNQGKLDEANKNDAFLITTEKDHVRIPDEFKSSVGIIHGEIVSDNNLGFTTEIEKYI